MSDMEQEHNIVCGLCDVETSVLVFDVDEKPVFCPMCGEQADVRPVSS